MTERTAALERQVADLTARLDTLEAAQRPASGRESDATGAEVRRQPENLSDDYGPFNTYTRTVAYMQAVRGQPNPTWVDITAEVELAALKARRCDGCAWWSSESGATWGFCEAFNDCATKPSHACNAWTPKPDPQAPKVDA